MRRMNSIATTAACVVPAAVMVPAHAAEEAADQAGDRADDPAPTEARSLTCTIEASREGDGVRLVAYAVAEQDTEVVSHLSATRIGPAGLSDSRQDGRYSVAAGGRTPVGEIVIGAGEADEVRAMLCVESRSNGVRCFYPMD